MTWKDIGTKRTQTGNRKEQRKASRILKKSAGYETKRRPAERGNDHSGAKKAPPASRTLKKDELPLKPILKRQGSYERNIIQTGGPKHDPPSPPPLKKLSHRVKNQLATDDAEIAALEKALKIKSNKKLPKSFEDDGLVPLLDGLGDAEDLETFGSGKRKRDESHEWLRGKRRRVQTQNPGTHENRSHMLSLSLDDVGEGTTSEFDEGSSDEEDSGVDDIEESDILAESSESLLDTALPTSKARENPYIAPQPAGTIAATSKYKPPSLRDPQLPDSEDFSRLKRKIQGHLNRLSEANLISILGEIESFYRTNARQHISALLVDNVLRIFSDPANLQDTFIILYAGFIAAVYKIIGAEFGAQMIQRIDGEFVHLFEANTTERTTDKTLSNLIRLLSELYNFQVVGNGLIYDFVRIFIQDFSETSVELLLQVVRGKL